jgi:hypothetical protein
MPITPFLVGQPFEPNQIEDMSAVLVAVCRELGLADRPDSVTEHVAKTIIELAQRGVRDKETLRKMTLTEFNVVEQGRPNWRQSGAPIDDVSRIRDRATRLFALALQAREQGHASADKLAKLAHETLAHAEELAQRKRTGDKAE